jgi:hypothetical protein
MTASGEAVLHTHTAQGLALATIWGDLLWVDGGWPGSCHEHELPARIQHPVHLGRPVQQGVFDLVGGKRDPPLGQRRVGEAELRRGIVAHPDRPDLACLDRVSHQAHQGRIETRRDGKWC